MRLVGFADSTLYTVIVHKGGKVFQSGVEQVKPLLTIQGKEEYMLQKI